jgi:hypothetical protein
MGLSVWFKWSVWFGSFVLASGLLASETHDALDEGEDPLHRIIREVSESNLFIDSKLSRFERMGEIFRRMNRELPDEDLKLIPEAIIKWTGPVDLSFENLREASHPADIFDYVSGVVGLDSSRLEIQTNQARAADLKFIYNRILTSRFEVMTEHTKLIYAAYFLHLLIKERAFFERGARRDLQKSISDEIVGFLNFLLTSQVDRPDGQPFVITETAAQILHQLGLPGIDEVSFKVLPDAGHRYWDQGSIQVEPYRCPSLLRRLFPPKPPKRFTSRSI